MSSANMDQSASNIQPQKWQAAQPRGKQEQKVGDMNGHSVSQLSGGKAIDVAIEKGLKELEGCFVKNEAKPGQPIKFKAASIKIGINKNYGALPTEKGAKEIILKELGIPKESIAIFRDRLTSKQIGNIRNAIDNNDPSNLSPDEKETYDYLTDIKETAESLGYGGLPVSENSPYGDITLEEDEGAVIEDAGKMFQRAEAEVKPYTTLPKEGAKVKPYTTLPKGERQKEAEIRKNLKRPYDQLDVSKIQEQKIMREGVRKRVKSLRPQTGYSESPSSREDVKQEDAGKEYKPLPSKYGFASGRGSLGYGVMPSNLASKEDLNQVQKQRANTAPLSLTGYNDTNRLRADSQKSVAKSQGYKPLPSKQSHVKPNDTPKADRTGKNTKIKNMARSVRTAISSLLWKIPSTSASRKDNPLKMAKKEVKKAKSNLLKARIRNKITGNTLPPNIQIEALEKANGELKELEGYLKNENQDL